MSPIYEDEKLTREQLFELRRRNRCQVCRGALDIFLDLDTHRAFLACRDWHRTHHEGIEREAEPPFELNIPTRREDMVQQLGDEKTTKLEKYEGVVSLTKGQAMYILQTIWPDAPEVEVIKAAMVCSQYGLNPLARHIFLIPFDKHNKKGEVTGVEWAIVRGIGADRLLAQRHHHFSYLDLSPRRMTEAEQKKTCGEVDKTQIWAITKIKDMDTGAEAIGIGSWPIEKEPHGVKKGNTKLHMACIRSERQALDRQYPGEMPQGVEIMDEKYIEAEYSISPKGGDKIGGPAEDKLGGEVKPGATILSPTKAKESTKIEVPAAELADIVGEGFSINPTWLDETLLAIKWDDDTAKSWLAKFNIDTQGDLKGDVLPRLTREQAEEFIKELQERATKQLDLFP